MAAPNLSADQLQRLFGRDLTARAIVPGIDLAADIALDGGDLATVSGIDALDQGLKLAILTRLGDRVFDVNYGFDGLRALGDETNPILANERIRVSLIATLLRDPRVKTVTDVQFDQQVFARTLGVRVAFTTIAGTQAVVDLSRVVPNA
jgi:phage baseplate assembly protein W